ncbi:hypothetical protein E2C01_038337 [Portunus trituberculatus]|uniref:Uncharacterized protein n=1 Tax=Portunus trituberculatus TaxID=210409 RepID=A0A5B7FHH8_PORTR|nr:hypothetical protein [Portunus trituberculatus]
MNSRNAASCGSERFVSVPISCCRQRALRDAPPTSPKDRWCSLLEGGTQRCQVGHSYAVGLLGTVAIRISVRLLDWLSHKFPPPSFFLFPPLSIRPLRLEVAASWLQESLTRLLPSRSFQVLGYFGLPHVAVRHDNEDAIMRTSKSRTPRRLNTTLKVKCRKKT